VRRLPLAPDHAPRRRCVTFIALAAIVGVAEARTEPVFAGSGDGGPLTRFTDGYVASVAG